jgi:predicted DNA-binding protein (MmcQ/YjbR family)
MNIDSLRRYCLSFPNATEDIQWGSDLLFRIAGKIFAVTNLEPPHQLSFKCTPEKFDELIEFDGIIPAPYMARNKWVTLERPNALSDSETKSLIKNSYEMIFAKLPKKTQSELVAGKKPVKMAKKSPRK